MENILVTVRFKPLSQAKKDESEKAHQRSKLVDC